MMTGFPVTYVVNYVSDYVDMFRYAHDVECVMFIVYCKVC